jgi:2'-5' RNA ligase
MKLAIVAYPSLDEIDQQRIESFRARHDPQAAQINVHFTLVFPVDAVPSELGSDIAVVAQSSQPISFAIRGTKVAHDVLGNVSHVFLVPDEGAVQITALHDRLYAGTLRPHLRSDIPFVPHMTVGAAADSQAAERLAEELSVHVRMVRGTIANIELVDVGTRHVQSIATYTLGTATATSARNLE